MLINAMLIKKKHVRYNNMARIVFAQKPEIKQNNKASQ